MTDPVANPFAPNTSATPVPTPAQPTTATPVANPFAPTGATATPVTGGAVANPFVDQKAVAATDSNHYGEEGLTFGDADLEGQAFELLPIGTYPAVTTANLELRGPGASGWKYLNVEYTIEDSNVAIANGRKMWDMVTLSPKAKGLFSQWLNALGLFDLVKGKIFKNEMEIYQAILPFVANRKVMLVVIHEMYQGVTREKIQNTLPFKENDPAKQILMGM